MTRIGLVAIDELADPEVRAIAEDLIEYKGFVPAHYRLEGHLPNLLKHVWWAHDAVYDDGPLDEALLKKVGIAVSMANGCEYCTGAYCGLLSADLDGGDDAVAAFQEAVVDGELSEFEGAVIDFALRINDDPHAVTDADFESLRRHGLSDVGFVQVVYQVNLVAGYNRLTTVFDAEYEHAYPRAAAERSLGDP